MRQMVIVPSAEVRIVGSEKRRQPDRFEVCVGTMKPGIRFGVPASAGEVFEQADALQLRKPCRLKAELRTSRLEGSTFCRHQLHLNPCSETAKGPLP